ncbi:MAG: hypothetical protein IJD82_02125 [Clostridia bacterium]|nr:hypothetical protein [Clostridia bacterium]
MFGRRMPFRERMAQFLYGRNGPDTIYNVCIWSAFSLAILGIFTDSLLMSLAYTLLFGYAIFRFMSRNVTKRRAENRAFCDFFASFKNGFKLGKRKLTDREHVYKKCPHCRAQLRLPRKKGEHDVCCPRCKVTFSVKI